MDTKPDTSKSMQVHKKDGNDGKNVKSAASGLKIVHHGHAKIHKKVEWKCTKCTYSTLDKRLLQSHQRVHNRVLRYTCENCGKGFIYHMQLTRHRESKNCQPS